MEIKMKRNVYELTKEQYQKLGKDFLEKAQKEKNNIKGE